MFGFGFYEVAIVCGVCMLLVAPGLIARRMRSLGQCLSEARKLLPEEEGE